MRTRDLPSDHISLICRLCCEPSRRLRDEGLRIANPKFHSVTKAALLAFPPGHLCGGRCQQHNPAQLYARLGAVSWS
jgi:hypothetical protein